MRKFLITCILCLYVHNWLEVQCQFDVADYSKPCGANFTTKTKIYDSKTNIAICSLQFLDLAEFTKAENDAGPGRSKCELSLKMENCPWPKTFSTYFEPLRVNQNVKVSKFAFSAPVSAKNISKHSLKRFMFDGLQELSSLDLRGNRIQTLDNDTMDDLRRLTEVDLSHNEIMMVPDLLFQHNAFLKRITLAENKMVTLADDVFKYTTKLLFLNLSHNALDHIGP